MKLSDLSAHCRVDESRLKFLELPLLESLKFDIRIHHALGPLYGFLADAKVRS